LKKGSQKILNGKFHSKISRKTKNKWEIIVQRDTIRILGIRGWRRQAGVGEDWWSLVREARTQKGL
jgi:hypothetical protein